MNTDETVVIGAGQAAAKCALQLRQLGYDGKITLIGDESTPPYQRPELSKAYLARSVASDEVIMLPPAMASELGIQLRLETSVSEVDISNRVVNAQGEKISFDKLVFASGGRARKRDGALNLRTIADAELLYSTLKTEQRLSIVGGGWLGLEVAATARSHGLDVHLYEQQDRLCARSIPAEISELLLEHHRGIGVNVHFGSELPQDTSDTVCACIGIEPNDQLARDAGIEVNRGILVNDRQMTSAPNVFAIGDCARHTDYAAMENWAYANVSAERAAYAICDIAVPVSPDFWLWSKQGDLLLQMRGDYRDAQECVVRKNGDSVCYFYLTDDRLDCCIAINDPALFGQSRILHRSGKKLDKTALVDNRVLLKSVTLSGASV